MPAPLVPGAMAAIAPALARQGLDLLSGVFRGEANGRVREIVELLAEKTGIDVNDVADGKLGEEQWAKLKDFELQHQGQLLETRQVDDTHNLEHERLAMADRADARGLQKISLESEDMVARRFIYWFAAGVTVLTFLFIFTAAFGPPIKTDAQQRIVDTVLGFLLGVTLSAIIQYFFGSSVGSKAKDDKIAQIRQQLPGRRGDVGGDRRRGS